ncbi:MAG: ABC transporter ATP-binding protein [Nodosilinea sp.]
MTRSLSPPTTPVLRLESLTRRYGPGVVAVDGISLTLAQGEILALLGPSGCGKTTLLRLIAGFEAPDGGDLYLGHQGRAGVSTLPPEDRDVGVVFQDYALFPHLTVAQNIAFGLETRRRRGRLSPAAVQQQTAEALTLVGLAGLEKRFPHQLSGGQQQRVALARALAPRPRLVLMDEPFSNLDTQVRVYLRQEVRSILHQVHASGIFVTHDQEEAMAMADQLAVMRQGRLEQWGSPEAVYREPISRFTAEFLTQANFLPAEVGPAGWQTEIGCFPGDLVTQVGIGVDTLTSFTRAEVMIRQEDLGLVADSQGTLVVRDRQFLGREYRYYLTTASGQGLYARLPLGRSIAAGDRVRPLVAPQQVRIYPPAPSNAPTSRPAIDY